MQINKQFFIDTLGWGFLLWLFGYVLGIMLFFMVDKSVIGYVLTPIGTIATLWVLMRKIKSVSFQYYFAIAIIWTILAVALDYFLIVKTFKPEDGYYKSDIYLYYALTFALPLLVGFLKKSNAEGNVGS